MRLELTDLWFCIDCTMIAANGDASGCESEARAAECEAALADMGPHVVPDGPHDDESEGADTLEFTWSACDCCGDSHGGSRVRFCTLAE